MEGGTNTMVVKKYLYTVPNFITKETTLWNTEEFTAK